MKRSVIITGSEGLLGKEISNYFKKFAKVHELDLSLGHDLTDEKFVKEWFFKNHADYLINCFAVNDNINKKRKKTTLFNFSLESFQDYLNVNIISLFSVCREFAKNNEKGSIVNFSASTGLVSARPDLYDGSHKHIGYSISKAGVVNLTKYFATHLAPNIRVNCIAPGGIENNQDVEFINKYAKLTPLKRMMKKEELNEIVEYLATEKSSYATGSTFVIDGGWTAW